MNEDLGQFISKRKAAWTAKPVPCEDCGVPLDRDCWRPGPKRSVCRSCQNKRYSAKTKDTPDGQRRRRRRALQAKLKRLEARIERDRRELVQVREALQKTLRPDRARRPGRSTLSRGSQ